MDWYYQVAKLENQSRTAACEQKITTKKAKYCSNTVPSLYFLERKKSRRKTTHFFALLISA